MATMTRSKAKPRKAPAKPTPHRTTLAPVITDLPLRRFTLNEYYALMDIGILKDGDPYELVNGVIQFKMTVNPPHAFALQRLVRKLSRIVPDDYTTRPQLPITLPNTESEPEPDFAIAVGDGVAYADRHPHPADLLLVVEISDTSLAADRDVMLRIYAAARIPTYWIVNIPEAQVEVYEQPRAGRNPTYRKRTDYRAGDTLPVTVRGTRVGEVAVSELFP